VEAVAEEKSPAIVALIPSVIKYGGLNYLTRFIKTAAENMPVSMPLHLDHGEGMETVKNVWRRASHL